MTSEEASAMQALIIAAVRVARTPMTGIDLCSPMARAIFALTMQLAAAGFIKTNEATNMGEKMPQEAIDAECA